MVLPPDAAAPDRVDRPGRSERFDRAATRLAQADYLGAASPTRGRREAALLAAYLTGLNPGGVLAGLMSGSLDLPAGFEAAVARRVNGEPLQYITGLAPFRHLDLAVGPGVLVPRSETELLVDLALDQVTGGAAADAGAAAPPLVVDLGSGSGAIAAAIASERPTWRVLAVEVSAPALKYACMNLTDLGVELLQADATSPETLAHLDGRVDLVVANPPYVPDQTELPPDVAQHEPGVALWGGGEDGLELPLAFLRRAAGLIGNSGVLVMEHNPSQAGQLRAAAQSLGLARAQTHQDLTGRERFLVAGAS